MKDPRQTQSRLGRTYWAGYHKAVGVTASRLGWVDIGVLEGIETRAATQPESRVGTIYQELMTRFADPTLAMREDECLKVKALYDEACGLVFPAATAFLRHAHALLGVTHSHSLALVDLEILREIDLRGYDDAAYKEFSDKMAARLQSNVSHTADVKAYSQFFEIYGEAVALRYLRSRPRLLVERIAEQKGVSTPDFRCVLKTDDEREYEFYVEVKTFDVAGGELHHKETLSRGLDTNIEIERQVRAGRRIAIGELEVAPYQAPGTKQPDSGSLIPVIEAITAKCRSAFKASQFAMGPTFALAFMDRLTIPGGKHALAPSYYDELPSGVCSSGVLWHAAYGTPGTPIFEQPDFEGRPTLYGRLEKYGLYTDTAQPFPGLGVVFLSSWQGEQKAWGLATRVTHDVAGDSDKKSCWDSDTIEMALHAMCEVFNDEGSTRAFELSRYER